MSEDALQITGEKKMKIKGKIYPTECRVPENNRRNKKVLSEQCKEIEGKKIEWERLEISSRKLEIPREHSCKDGLNKGQKWYGPKRSRRY